ncbi:DUF4397 domain-containing protein [Jeotgalibacillus soli]|uniref:Peptidase n=1 Tax=Jeotgalibacillus soli TaxID=889306 RepID=A0A0C2VN18_9BACL|nr:DUF4397 domain-containing protein [Jeotgalibacillus soli]KIL45851.1 peptidase [Jeotgalibacillus soli]
MFLSSIVAAIMMAAIMAGAVSANGEEVWVRVLHASPDAPAVDVYVNGTAVVEGAEFKAYTNYFPLPAGEHEVELFPAGDTSTVLFSKTLTVEAGHYYTASAINLLESN